MRIKLIPFLSLIAVFGIALAVGFLIGLPLPGAAGFALLVAVPFTWLEIRCGLKIMLLPISGLVFGLLAVLFVQLSSGGTPVGLEYYLFGPALSLCGFTLVGSVLFLAVPKLRTRVIPEYKE